MHIINDIQLLVDLGKNGVLKHLQKNCTVGISKIKLDDYSGIISQGLTNFCPQVQRLDSDEEFPIWNADKRLHLTFGDLDSLYLAMRGNAVVVCSRKDFRLAEMAKVLGINNEDFDAFITHTIEDKRAIITYQLLKAI